MPQPVSTTPSGSSISERIAKLANSSRPVRAASEQITLRSWQQQALRAFESSQHGSFLTVACPGAGKTTFSLVAARHWCAGQRKPLVVVVPTQHLKNQWANAALRFGLHFDPDWSASDGPPATDMHGVVVTYAQAATSAAPLRSYCESGLVILDEVHHAANERSWGDAVALAFGGAAKRLLLSGTPFRSDNNPMPFVRYSDGDYGEAIADYEYGYGEALKDGAVVRPVYFPRFDGHMEWVGADGEVVEATFEETLSRTDSSARLRTALSADGEWIRTVIDKADAKLKEIRKSHPRAAGLVIATDQEHAMALASIIEARTGDKVRVALSNDPRASQVIADFATGDDAWIVAVRMISEGVDIPRLRVAIYATTTTTALFFRQAVGRIARFIQGVPDQKAYMFLPNDARLRTHAVTLAESRRHSIEYRSQREGSVIEVDELADDPGEQISLFQALTSTAVDAGESSVASGMVSETDGLDPEEKLVTLAEDLVGYPVDVPPPPPLPGVTAFAGSAGVDHGGSLSGAAEVMSVAAKKRSIRDSNSDKVREIASRTGLSHREVNSQLNRQIGITRISSATTKELEQRLAAAVRWINSLR